MLLDRFGVGGQQNPVLANLFVGFQLNRGYVYGIMYLFNCEKDPDKLFNFLNLQHCDIKIYVWETRG